MGYSIAWVAVKNMPLKKMLDCLRLEATAQTGTYARERYTGHELQQGWYLIVGRGCNSSVIASSNLAELSMSADVVACSVEEHVMFSSAEYWSHGHQRWRVEHAAERSPSDIKTTGLPPNSLNPLVRSAEESRGREPLSEQRYEVDYHFSVPLHLAKELTGFMHDEEHPSLNYDGFSVFKKRSALPGWWHKWFAT